MAQIISTYQLASEKIAAYVRPLELGDLAMPFDLKDETGRAVRLADDNLSGSPLVLVFLNEPDSQDAEGLLKILAESQNDFDSNGTKLVVVSADSHASRNRERVRKFGLAVPILGDSTGAVFASYGLHKGGDHTARIVLLSRFRQVRAWFDWPQDRNFLETLMALTQTEISNDRALWSIPHAPILVIPNVLSPAECAGLVRLFEEDAPFMIRRPQQGEVSGNYSIPVYEHNRQDRIDLILRDQAALNLIDQRINERIAPMVKKAFAFDINRREDLHIARYVGERGGNQMGHRDNTSTATAYRRFALSMNLNDDFDNGEIVFREFSQQGYRGAPGTALVFSSSLLHEVLETTSGTRYNLISHFFNDTTAPGR